MRRKRALAEAADLVDIESRLAPHVLPEEPAAPSGEAEVDEADAVTHAVPAKP